MPAWISLLLRGWQLTDENGVAGLHVNSLFLVMIVFALGWTGYSAHRTAEAMREATNYQRDVAQIRVDLSTVIANQNQMIRRAEANDARIQQLWDVVGTMRSEIAALQQQQRTRQ